MKTIPCGLLAASLFLLGYPSFAQEPQVPQAPQHAPDGGTRETFDSIFIPSMPNAPFAATVRAEWIRHLPDGSNITLKNHRIVVRDSAGRIYQERALFVPDDGKHVSTVRQIEISDPAAHEIYVCRVAERFCRLMEFSPRAFVASPAVSAPPNTAGGAVSMESLGTQTISGLETVGSQETTLVESETLGNEAPLLAKREFWYSPQLGINLITKRQNPQFASEQNFEVTDITLGEPDAKLFELPSGYKVIDLRKQRVFSSPQTSPEN
jgi:hypothetical protein